MKKELESYVASSQIKVFPDTVIDKNFVTGTAFNNEPYSITLAYKSDEWEYLPISVSVKCDGLDTSVYKVEYVPIVCRKGVRKEVACEERGNGLYPDMLLKRDSAPTVIETKHYKLPYYEKDENNILEAIGQFQSLLIIFNEDGKVVKGGEYDVTISITSRFDGRLLDEHHFMLKIIDKSLPASNITYTNWFHYDCLADIHNVELYSDKYFEILGKYFKNAVKHQMNTILLPAFTPPLDTVIGEERKNVQLVGIKKDENNYEFDFTLLKKFIEFALDCGFEYIEHSHFFAQWGAKCSPNIYGEVDGKQQRIFGWETDATGDEYKNFLEQYIPEFLKVAMELDIEDRLFFHISDEPTPDVEESYTKAVRIVEKMLEGYKSGDALSSVIFHEKGLVKTPIVSVDRADDFFGKCDSLWLYYTGGYYGNHNLEKCTNRLITTKPYRARILGLHLYKYKCTGFLHWGYNFYYGCMSHGLIDPKINPCGFKNKPGAAFLVYPGYDEAIPSLREKYMCEAMNDCRALKLLEKYIGYEEVIKLCEGFFGCEIDCTTIPKSHEQMLEFREMINREIEKYM